MAYCLLCETGKATITGLVPIVPATAHSLLSFGPGGEGDLEIRQAAAK
jgi:hypothetical protein